MPIKGTVDLDIADGGPTPEEVLCETERRAALLQAVGQLREKLRIIVLPPRSERFDKRGNCQIPGCLRSAPLRLVNSALESFFEAP